MTRTRIEVLGAGILLICLSLAPYAGTLDHGYVNIDDPYTIVDYPLLRELSWETLPELFRVQRRPGVVEYMPLKDLSYAIDMAILGESAPSLRPQQLFWYAICVLLFWLWLRRIGMEHAWLIALLFGLHPAHVESVTWLSGRKDLLSGAFMLAAMCVAVMASVPSASVERGRKAIGRAVGVLGFQVLALLSKPMAVVAPGLIVLQDMVSVPRERWRQLFQSRWPLYVGLLAIVASFSIAYVAMVGTTDPFVGESEAYRVFEGPAVLRWGQQLAGFVWLAVQPGALAPTLPLLLDPSPLSPQAILGVLVLVGCVAGLLALWWRSSRWALALGLFVIPLTPILVFPPWAQYLAGRYLFLSVGGLSIAIGLAIAAVERRLDARPWLPYLLFGVVATAWAASTVAYNVAWKDSLSLWSSVSERYPSFAYSHRLAGGGALEKEDEGAAYYWFARCLEARPEEAACAAELSRLMARRDPEAAQRLLRGVLQFDYDGAAHRELARLMVHDGNASEALALYEGWLEGRAVKSAWIAPAIDLALVAQEPRRALAYARQLLAAQVQQHPTSAPPTDTFLRIATALGDTELASRVEEASRGCARCGCFERAMGWSQRR
jgi:hypothetical protein